VARLSCTRTIRCTADGRQVTHVVQAFHDGQHSEGARSSNLQAAGALPVPALLVKTAVEHIPACTKTASWAFRDQHEPVLSNHLQCLKLLH